MDADHPDRPVHGDRRLRHPDRGAAGWPPACGATTASCRRVEETTGRAYRVDDPDLLLWVHNCAVDSILSTARRAGLALTDEEADRYVEEQVAFAHLVGVPLETAPRSVAEMDAYFEAIRPTLAVTPAAVKGVRDLFLPPMPGVAAGADAGPAGVGLARRALLRTAARVGPADVLAAGTGAHRRRGDRRAAGLPGRVPRAAAAGVPVTDRAGRLRPGRRLEQLSA